MNRREFLISTALTGISAAQGGASLPRRSCAPEMIADALPSADQVAWQDMEVGMFVHFAPNTWQDVESDNLSTPLSQLNPKELNTDQWAETALALGAKYLVFVAKHQGGFCMWQTHTTDYGIRNTPWKDGHGDVLAEVAASCRRYGLKLGVYVCPRDDHFGAKTGGICATPELQARYDAMYRQQLKEVLGNYGSVVEAWFDGSTRTPVSDLLLRYQPHAMVFQGSSATIRWVGNEDGYAPYPCWNGIDAREAKTGTATSLNSDPDGSVWMPNELDVSIRRPYWFWSTKNENNILNLDELLSIYYRSVGRGAQLLLNIPANTQGLLPPEDCAVAKAFGAEIKHRFSAPLAEISGEGTSLVLHLHGTPYVDTLILQEDTRRGERVRHYRLEGRTNGSWVPIGEGSAVGHKRIQPVTRAQYAAVRLRVSDSAGRPFVRALAAFDTGQPPPPNWDAPTAVWGANLVGSWQEHAFHLDVTKHINAAAQYRLHFVAIGGTVEALTGLTLRLHGVAEPALVKQRSGHPEEVVLDITELGGSVTLDGRVEGADRGSVTLQQL